jgi:hypothetical protein
MDWEAPRSEAQRCATGWMAAEFARLPQYTKET